MTTPFRISAPPRPPLALRRSPALARGLGLALLLCAAPSFASAAVRTFTETLEAVSPASLTLAAGKNSPRLGGGLFSASSGGGRLTLSQGPGLGKDAGGGVQLIVIEPAEKYAIIACAIDSLDAVSPPTLTARDLSGAFVSFDLSAPAGRIIDVYLEFAPNGPDNERFWTGNAPYANRLMLGRVRGEGDFRTVRYVISEKSMPSLQKFVDYARSTASPDFRVRIKWAIGDHAAWEPDSVLRLDNITLELP